MSSAITTVKYLNINSIDGIYIENITQVIITSKGKAYETFNQEVTDIFKNAECIISIDTGYNEYEEHYKIITYLKQINEEED